MQTNKIIFKRSDYESTDALLKAIGAQMSSLMNNNYMCSTYRSVVDNNIHVVEFSSADVSIGGLYPVWLTTEEIMSVFAARKLNMNKDLDDEQNDLWLIDPKTIKDA